MSVEPHATNLTNYSLIRTKSSTVFELYSIDKVISDAGIESWIVAMRELEGFERPRVY